MSRRLESAVLSNGLRVLCEEMPSMHSVTLGFFVKTGSRDEDTPLAGVSHFLEHMTFKGNEEYDAHRLNAELDRMGSQVVNASTGWEWTNYFAKMLPEYAPRALELLGGMMRPALRTEDFTTEKNVILEEIAMYQDRPEHDIVYRALEQLFGFRQLGIPILGTPESIKAMTAEGMRAYWTRRYRPSRMWACAVGRIAPEAFFDGVRKVAGAWEDAGGNGGPNLRAPSAAEGVGTRVAVPRDGLRRVHLLWAIPTAPLAHPLRRAAELVADVLGRSRFSRLYWTLIDTGLADSAEMSYQGFEDVGIWWVYVSCAETRRHDVEGKVEDLLAGAGGGAPVTEAELEAARSLAASHAVLGGEQGVSRFYRVGADAVSGLPYQSPRAEAEEILAVTVRQCAAAIEAFPLSRKALTLMGPPGVA